MIEMTFHNISNFHKIRLASYIIYIMNKMAKIAISRVAPNHVPEGVETSFSFWYILRQARHHKKIFKFLGQRVPDI